MSITMRNSKDAECSVVGGVGSGISTGSGVAAEIINRLLSLILVPTVFGQTNQPTSCSWKVKVSIWIMKLGNVQSATDAHMRYCTAFESFITMRKSQSCSVKQHILVVRFLNPNTNTKMAPTS